MSRHPYEPTPETHQLMASIAESLTSIAASLAGLERMQQQIPQIQRMDARPGDVFVIQCDRVLSPAQRSGILEQWEKLMPNAPLMVIDGGMTLGIVGEDSEYPDDPQPDTYLDGSHADTPR